jgi:HEAT repeat protein
MDTSQNRIEDLIRDLFHRDEEVRWAASSALAGQGPHQQNPLWLRWMRRTAPCA